MLALLPVFPADVARLVLVCAVAEGLLVFCSLLAPVAASDATTHFISCFELLHGAKTAAGPKGCHFQRFHLTLVAINDPGA